jgi:O-methyltransferase involved in polyketide biosynthesis
MPTYNEKSSFTAQGLVLRRMLWTDLPLSREIFDAFEKIHPATAADWQFIKDSPFVPTFEVRYRMTDRILAQKGIKQIFELASGLSPRGLVMAAADPACTFVEVDLPDEIALKRAVIGNLVTAGAIKSPGKNFQLLEGSVIEEKVFAKAAALFREEPVAVVCEGLLRYLSFDDKTILVQHVYNLLKKFGGVWITPDIESLDNRQQTLSRQTPGMRGVDVEKNIFPTLDAAREYFEGFGFTIQATPLADMVGECVSPRKYGLTPEQAVELLDGRTMFTMTVE